MDFVGSFAIRVGFSAIAYHQTSNLFIKCLAFAFVAKTGSDFPSLIWGLTGYGCVA